MQKTYYVVQLWDGCVDETDGVDYPTQAAAQQACQALQEAALEDSAYFESRGQGPLETRYEVRSETVSE